MIQLINNIHAIASHISKLSPTSSSVSITFFGKKNVFFQENYKDDQNINCFFKILAKFGDHKHNKDMEKNCGKKMFL